jgi:Rieske 2Fe-2S family protein
MAFRPRATLPETAFTLPARYYTDPALFERELDVFYRRMWIGVARLEDIPERGAWITRQIAGDNFIIVRALDGTAGAVVRAFYNVCRHRGTQLCVGDHGEFAGAIRCPYHAWTYDYEGKLIGAPHMDGSPGFDRTEFPLRDVRAGVWDGFVYVS